MGHHRVGFASGNSLDFFVSPGVLDGSRDLSIPVFFSGAVTKRVGTRPPYFSGAKISKEIGTEYIAFSDPSLNLDAELALGWYAGSEEDCVQDLITRILTEIVKRTARHLLLVGGSGGGFAALYYANRVGSMSSAFVWNPQTDILEYAPNSVSEYLEIALSLDERARTSLAPESSSKWKVLARQRLTEAGIDSTVDTVGCSRVFYLQNATDWHLRKHLGPFLQRNDYVHRGNGLYTNATNHCVIVSAFGAGHAVPPHGLIQAIITAMLNPGLSTRKIYNDVVEVGLLPSDFVSLPVDLRNDWTRGNVLEGIESIYTTDGYRVRVICRRPRGYGGLTGHLTAYFKGDVVASVAMDRDLSGVIAERNIDAVSVRIQDGFGNVLGSFEDSVIPTNKSNGE